MFDHVDMEGGVVACPCCGEPIDDTWQTKQGDCDLGWLPWWDVEQFHTICEGCDELIEMHLGTTDYHDAFHEALGLRGEQGKPPILYHQFMISYDACEKRYDEGIPATWLALPRNAM